MKRNSTRAKLPGIAFARIVSTGETVAIRLGEARYLGIETDKTPEELNSLYGVTPAQARAMLAGVLLGWRTRLANPALYGPRGELLEDPALFCEDEPAQGFDKR